MKMTNEELKTRDRFAAAALKGYITNPRELVGPKSFAFIAADQADAMMAERTKRTKKGKSWTAVDPCQDCDGAGRTHKDGSVPTCERCEDDRATVDAPSIFAEIEKLAERVARQAAAERERDIFERLAESGEFVGFELALAAMRAGYRAQFTDDSEMIFWFYIVGGKLEYKSGGSGGTPRSSDYIYSSDLLSVKWQILPKDEKAK